MKTGRIENHKTIVNGINLWIENVHRNHYGTKNESMTTMAIGIDDTEEKNKENKSRSGLLQLGDAFELILRQLNPVMELGSHWNQGEAVGD
ncbi:UNVERIFIED_CONTAM: hypothetical protein K2H54_054007 [Gekko kuhli]